MELYANARTSRKASRTNGIVNGADDGGGLRRSHQALLRLIDTTDPAWPSVAALLREMAEAGVEIDEAAHEIAAKLGAYRHRLAMLDAYQSRHRQPVYVQITLAVADSSSIVYYIRRGDLVKIGTTTGPAVRFRDLMPDEILAIEPGGEDLEMARHRQFDHLRYRGEYFRSAPELLEHARQLRRLHGTPDPSWPTTATPGAQRPGASLPPVISHETVTVSEAATRFGIKEQRIYGWARRGLVSPAGQDGRRHLFYVEHIAAIRDRMDRHVPLSAVIRRHMPASAARCLTSPWLSVSNGP